MKTKLFVDVLEKVDKEFLLDDKYAKIRTKAFANRSGIYALYDKRGKLYYVGRASDLNGRLKQHSKHNKHSGKWDSFSIYLTKKKNIEIELEAIVLSFLWETVQPKGNTQKPQVNKDRKMREDILKEMHKISENMFGKKKSRARKSSVQLKKSKNNKVIPRGGKTKSSVLKGLVMENTPLKAELKRKGEVFHAILFPSGEIEYQGKRYSSPSKAAQIAKQTKSENGWTVWKIQDRFNQWVTLNEFIKK